MAMWIDSHAHLDDFVNAREWPAVWTRAHAEGIDAMVAIGGSVEANACALRCAAEAEGVYAVLGYDRDEAPLAPDRQVLESMLTAPKVVGVGETGLDYYYSRDTATAQCALLEMNLEVARARQLPVVIHTREANADTLRLLSTYADRWSGPGAAPGVIHCFTGDAAFATALLDIGFMISFSGIVTFKNADALRAALRVVPEDRLLVETDAPYLAPVPMRGTRNEPAYVRYVGESIAATLGRAPEEIAALTSTNTRTLFNLP